LFQFFGFADQVAFDGNTPHDEQDLAFAILSTGGRE
jgi:hypothetical protein